MAPAPPPDYHLAVSTRDIWNRVREGQHSALLGDASAGEPPPDILVIEVDCDLHGPPLSPLIALCEQVEALLGDRAAAGRLPYGSLRRRFMGDTAEPMHPGRLVGTLNRLAASAERPVVVRFHAVDRADPATQEMLLAVLSQPGWLRLPLILSTSRSDSDLAKGLGEVLEDDAIIAAPAPSEGELPEIPELPDVVIQVLRAGAMVGDTFEVETVAELLVSDPIEILEALQTAHDRGVPLRDRGRGVFSLPPAMAEALRAQLLPSLRQAWHQLLAELHGAPLGGDEGEEPGAEPVPAQKEAIEAPDLAELLEGAAAATPELDEIVERAGEGLETAAEAGPARAPARAARHAAEAGQLEIAIRHQIAVVEHAVLAGAFNEAAALARRAAEALDALPRSRASDLLRAQLEHELGRLSWLGVGASAELTLGRALEHLDAGLELAESAGEPTLMAAIQATAASVRFDLGDAASLERAVRDLTTASLALSRAGLPLDAARLLNDQAALCVRMGDPVRAYYLLKRSREVFERAGGAVARLELAETEHQTARLLLHAEVRPGREEDAIDAGLEHAARAAETYEELGLERELGRVWELMGRLALRGGRLDVAGENLERAFALQQELGDGIGLARTAGAFAELFARGGAPERAVAALADSVELNVAKGSPIGLAFNLAALEKIDPEVVKRVGAEGLRERIRGAQEVIGQVESPDAIYG